MKISRSKGIKSAGESYSPASFFPSDGGRRRECRRVLRKIRPDEESGDYMEPLNQARCRRAEADIEKNCLDRTQAIEESCRRKQAEILRLRQALKQLENDMKVAEMQEEEWEYEF